MAPIPLFRRQRSARLQPFAPTAPFDHKWPEADIEPVGPLVFARAMLELIGADICRDGGSIALEYRKENGELVSVLLEVDRYPDGETPTYGHLHIGREIQNRCDVSTIVAKGSNEERLLLKDIEALRRLAPTGARDNTMHWLRQLSDRLPDRRG